MSTLSTVGEEAPPTARADDDFGGKSSGRAIRDQLARVLVWTAFLIALIPLIWILGSS